MSEWPTESLKLASTGPTIGLELNSYYEVLGEAFWSFIEERLIRIVEGLSKQDDPLTVWAYLEATGALVLHFIGGGPEAGVRQAILDNIQDLGFDEKDVIITAINPSAEPLFGTRGGKMIAFIEEFDPETHEEGPKGIVFHEGEFFWAGYQIGGEPESVDYSLYRIAGDEEGSYHIEEERKVPLYFSRYKIEE